MASRTFFGIAWPAFLAACLLELLVFALVDPLELNWSGHSLGLGRQAVHTLAFFAFWAVAMVSGALTALLSLPSAEVNADPPNH
jgi:hypothetical protein